MAVPLELERGQADAALAASDAPLPTTPPHRRRRRRDRARNSLETAVRVVWRPMLVIRALDPHYTGWDAVPVRLSCIALLYVAALAATYRGFGNAEMWAVGLAAMLAPMAVRAMLVLTEHVLFPGKLARARKGEWAMVSWLSFTFFMEMVYAVLVSIFGPAEKDARESPAIRAAAAVYDERTDAELAPDGRFVVDFVADTGDGFDPTFTVASLLGRGELTVEERRADGSREAVALPRARVVVHGGDICYPLSTFDNFFHRFCQPYAWAFPAAAAGGERMYLAAGNHEWMDGLDGYRSLVLPRDRLGGWQLPQRGSYFALRLPYNWVMFVLDIGPEPEDIDAAQQAWFDAVPLSPDERVILVYHLPEWIKCGALGFSNMARLRAWRRASGDRVRLVLTGDLHYYRRMERADAVAGDHVGAASDAASDVASDAASAEEDLEKSGAALRTRGAAVLNDDDGGVRGVRASLRQRLSTHAMHTQPLHAVNCVHTRRQQFVVAGHGGAFNHATHFPRVRHVPLLGGGEPAGARLRTCCEFPSVRESRRHWDANWLRMFVFTTNHVYARFIGGVYMFFFMGVSPNAYPGSRVANPDLLLIPEVVVAAARTGFFWASTLTLLVVFFIMTSSNYEIHSCGMAFGAVALAVLHVGAHLGLAFVARFLVDVSTLSAFAAAPGESQEYTWAGVLAYCLSANLFVFVVGAVGGSLVSSVYFRVSVDVCHWHYNEAISMTQIEDYKGFVRIAIQPNGDLDLYAIVTDRTQRRWVDVPEARRTEERPAVREAVGDRDLGYYLLEKVTLSKDA